MKVTGKPRKDTTRVLRLNMILDTLNRRTPYGGVTIKELAEKFEVSERQIRRDLNNIENVLVIPLLWERTGSGIRIRLKSGYLPSLSPESATVVFLSLLQQKGSALSGYINRIKDAIISTLFKYHYDPKKVAIDRLQNRIHVVEEMLADPQKTGDVFIKLVDALKYSYRVRLHYFTGHSQELTARVVEPYGLICKHQNWYLVAHCLMRNDIRVFRVDQIENVFPLTSQHFSYPQDFSLKDYMASCWGVINDGQVCRVLVKFDSSVAYRVKKVLYHPSQEITEELVEDGSVIASYEVCGMSEMISWLMQWGDAAEVIYPQSLRDEIRDAAEKIARLYVHKP